MSPAPDLWMKNYNLKEDNRDHPVEWSTNLTLLNYTYLLFSKKDSSFFVLLTMLSIEKYIWYFLRKRQVFLSLFLLTMFSRHCKLDLLHSLMLPPKGPALHIHLNNMKTRKITKRQWKKKNHKSHLLCYLPKRPLCTSIWTTWIQQQEENKEQNYKDNLSFKYLMSHSVMILIQTNNQKKYMLKWYEQISNHICIKTTITK